MNVSVNKDFIKNKTSEEAELQIKIIKKAIEICYQSYSKDPDMKLCIEKNLIEYKKELEEYAEYFPEFII